MFGWMRKNLRRQHGLLRRLIGASVGHPRLGEATSKLMVLIVRLRRPRKMVQAALSAVYALEYHRAAASELGGAAEWSHLVGADDRQPSRHDVRHEDCTLPRAAPRPSHLRRKPQRCCVADGSHRDPIRRCEVRRTARWREHVLVPASLRDIWRARREIGNGLSDADVHVVNTQVPAVIGPRRSDRCRTSSAPTSRRSNTARGPRRTRTSPDRSSLVGSLKHRWNRSVLQRAAAVVGWSNWVRSSMITDYGVDPERCHVIPPGVDTSRFAPAERRPKTVPRILFVGADFERKGGPELIDAFRALPDGAAELVLVTKAPWRRRRGSASWPTCSPTTSVSLTCSSPATSLLCRVEPRRSGSPRPSEHAAGLPIVATGVGGLADIVEPDVTGCVVPVGDPRRLRAALDVLIADPQLRLAMGAAARRRAVERFDALRNATALLDLARRFTR